MIGKSHSGSGFGGLTRYLIFGKKDDPKPDRVEWTSTRELALEEPREAALLMRRTAAQGRTEEPVHHISISLAPGEHLSREKWEQVVDRTLKDLSLEGHQILIVAHRDTNHEHVHLMVNRVHPETFRAWNRWQDRPRLMASLRVQELELGLHFTPYVHDPDRLPERLMQAFIHTGEPPFMDYARATARPIFKEARSWAELHERLAAKGLYLERKGQGLVVTDDRRHVKASSVDRGASLRALETRLGPYEERRPLLPEVDSDLRGDRRSELYAQVAPALRASHEADDALKGARGAAGRLHEARENVRSAIGRAFRNPAQVERRYFAHLDQEKALPPLNPAELGELRGTVLHAGRNALPVGVEGSRAWEAAAKELPQYATAYLRAQEDLARAEAGLAVARQTDARLRESFRPKFAELDEIQSRSATLHERLLSLRPRDQIALARRHGRDELERAARRSPEHAIGPLASRQQWMQNLSRELNRALDRRLHSKGLTRPGRDGDLVEWTRQALDLGLHPLHAVQALTRGKVPLAEAARAVSVTYSAARHPVRTVRGHGLHAVQSRTGLPLAGALQAFLLSRAVIRNPLRTSLFLTTQALGLPSLPVRLATMAWDLVRERGRSR